MYITSLEKMEKIVEENKYLFWDGWDVFYAYKTDKARTSKYGKIIDNKWHIVKKISCTREGWEIPEKFI